MSDRSQIAAFFEKPEEERMIAMVEAICGKELTLYQKICIKHLTITGGKSWVFLPRHRNLFCHTTENSDPETYDQMIRYATMRKELAGNVFKMMPGAILKRKCEKIHYSSLYGDCAMFTSIDDIPYVEFPRQSHGPMTLSKLFDAFFSRHGHYDPLSTLTAAISKKYNRKVTEITKDCFTPETIELRMSYPQLPEDKIKKRKYHGDKNQCL